MVDTARQLTIRNATSTQSTQQQQLNGMSPAGTAAASNPSNGGYAATLAAQSGGGSNPTQVMAALTADSGGTLQVVNDQAPYYLQIDISDYVRTGWNSVGQFVANTTVVMPMPVNLGTRQSVAWEKKKLNTLGAATMAVLGGNSGSLLSGNKAADAAAITAKAGTTLANGNIVQGGLAYYGLAENDYETLMLTGPTLKEYTFRFELSAKTPQESAGLQSLFNILSGAAAPGLGSGAASMFFTYPKMVQLTFHGPIGTLESQLFAFKPAVIVDLAWDFAPQGQPSFYVGGSPESIVLQLSLTELTYWLAGDYSVNSTNNLAGLAQQLGSTVGAAIGPAVQSVTNGLKGG